MSEHGGKPLLTGRGAKGDCCKQYICDTTSRLYYNRLQIKLENNICCQVSTIYVNIKFKINKRMLSIITAVSGRLDGSNSHSHMAVLLPFLCSSQEILTCGLSERLAGTLTTRPIWGTVPTQSGLFDSHKVTNLQVFLDICIVLNSCCTRGP